MPAKLTTKQAYDANAAELKRLAAEVIALNKAQQTIRYEATPQPCPGPLGYVMVPEQVGDSLEVDTVRVTTPSGTVRLSCGGRLREMVHRGLLAVIRDDDPLWSEPDGILIDGIAKVSHLGWQSMVRIFERGAATSASAASLTQEEH